MPKCAKCDEEFNDDEGTVNEYREFVCDDCSLVNAEEESQRCPKCQGYTEEYAASSVCESCGYGTE